MYELVEPPDRIDGPVPPGTIVRDRLKMRDTEVAWNEKVGDRSLPRRVLDESPETIYPCWWTPDRSPVPVSVSRREVESFRKRLKGINPDLELSWHPIREMWQVWIREPRVRSWWCRGWKRLIFADPWQLNTETIAALYKAYPEKCGRARATFQEFMDRKQREQRRFEKNRQDEMRHYVRDHVLWRKKIRNIGDGSRFSEMYD